ncbi:MAG: hypothetical protein CW338_00960 [Clostridiales bacterium]|nr:hypothetical protein [Clostridiales bacterium]
MGFRVEELLALAKDDETDAVAANELCEKLTGFLQGRETGEKTEKTVENTKQKSAKTVSPATQEALDRQKSDLDSEYDRQLDRFRNVHQNYASQLREQYKDSLQEIRKSHAEALALEKEDRERQVQDLKAEISRQRKKNSRLVILLIAETALITAMAVADLLMGYAGWFRR